MTLRGQRLCGFLLALVPAVVSLGCPSHKKQASQKDTPNEPSPNASILPAPLASGTELVPRPHASSADAGRGGIPADSAGRLIVPEAGAPPPRSFRGDEALPRDTLTQRDAIGATLEAQWKWFELPAAATVPELDKDGLKRAREKTALNVTVDLALAGRMRLAFTSVAFPLPPHSELRARDDRYGHVLVWPNGQAYRVLQPGALRAMFAERRADVLPLVTGKLKQLGKGQALGFDTSKVQLSSPIGRLVLEQARVTGTGSSGELLCRLLVELVAVQPSSSACGPELVPLDAEFTWTTAVDSASRSARSPAGRTSPSATCSCRPPAHCSSQARLPPQSSGVFLTRNHLAALHSRAAKAAPPPPRPPRAKDCPPSITRTRCATCSSTACLWRGSDPRSQQYVIGPLSRSAYLRSAGAISSGT